jgi:two-component system sensor histidine kinase GlrK
MPLLAGVVSAALNITRLSDSSERLVLHGVEATRYTQAIVRQIAAMERSARLYQLLGRSELLDVFDENRRRMNTVLDALERLPGDGARPGLIAELRRQTEVIATGLGSGGRLEVAAALRNFGALSQVGGQLSVLASRQIDRELVRLQEDTKRARTRLLWQSAALVPISLGLAFVFTLLLGRPIRDIDEAIRKLGHGELAEPIKVKVTTDLEALGRQIEWLRRRLLEVSEERERFLRHMSHELKTPLANIREGTELLLDG